jgi:hypothetical protein
MGVIALTMESKLEGNESSPLTHGGDRAFTVITDLAAHSEHWYLGLQTRPVCS